jgi:hypothetical protein
MTTPDKNTVKPTLPPGRKGSASIVENPEYVAFLRRILRAYARRVASGDIEALRAMTVLASDVDAATRDAITGLRAGGYSWSDIAAQLGVTRQAAQMRWGAKTDRGRIDERLLAAGLTVAVPVLVTIYVDHFRTSSLVGACPGCGFEYTPTKPECPTLAVVRPLLYRRRHENRSAVSRLTPAQNSYLRDRRGTPGRFRPASSTRGGSSLLEPTGGR